MEFIPQDEKIGLGDTVITSGLGGNFPKNLVIGQVDDVRHATMRCSSRLPSDRPSTSTAWKSSWSSPTSSRCRASRAIPRALGERMAKADGTRQSGEASPLYLMAAVLTLVGAVVQATLLARVRWWAPHRICCWWWSCAGADPRRLAGWSGDSSADWPST